MQLSPLLRNQKKSSIFRFFFLRCYNNFKTGCNIIFILFRLEKSHFQNYFAICFSGFLSCFFFVYVFVGHYLYRNFLCFWNKVYSDLAIKGHNQKGGLFCAEPRWAPYTCKRLWCQTVPLWITIQYKRELRNHEICEMTFQYFLR